MRSRRSRGTSASATALAVSREAAKHVSLPRARAPCRAVYDRPTHYGRILQWQKPLCFSARPWCDARAVTFNAQLAFAWHVNKRHCAGCLSGGGETHELAARARRALLFAIGLRDMEEYCSRKRLSVSLQDRGATRELLPQTRIRHLHGTRTSTTALAVSRKVAKHASLPHARAVPRWL